MSASGDGPDNIASRGPFSFLAGDYSELIDLFEHYFQHIDGPSIVDVSKDVVDLPPEERFTESMEVFKAIYGFDRSKSLDSLEPEDADQDFASFVENISLNQLPAIMQLLEGQFEKTRNKAFERVITNRNKSEEYLITVVFLQRLIEAIQNIENSYYQDDKSIERISPLVVLLCRLVLIAEDEQTEFTNDFFRDIVRAKQYVSQDPENQPDPHPEELEIDEVVFLIRREGAVIVYENKDISVGRGAELAGMTTSQFEELLIHNGIVPRYGPKEGEELLQGPGLSKSG